MKPLLPIIGIATLSLGLLAAISAGKPPVVESDAQPDPFRLPAGDEVAGRKAFVSIGCVRCHAVAGVEFNEADGPVPGKFLDLQLGHKESGVASYGQLVTAITNPEHVFSKRYKRAIEESGDANLIAFMPKMNAEMTVEQLLDLLQFLDARYRLHVPGYQERSPRPKGVPGDSSEPKA